MALKRQNYSWWRFFDKAGDNANFTYSESLDKWTGTIYIDSVSVDLIEYEPLYVLQQVYDNVNAAQLGLRYPRKLNFTGVCAGATEQNVQLRWKDEVVGSTATNVPEIFLWSMQNYPGPDPSIAKHDNVDIDLGSFAADAVGPTVGPPIGGTGQSLANATSNFKDEALSVRVGLQGATAGSYYRTLQIVDPNYLTEDPYNTFTGCTTSSHVFAEITFYGETIGEDERLETMLENFGTDIQGNDFKIFDDVDINEAYPDYQKLNYKRKELLLQWEQIFPYTGSYKALINILKYFGYDQVTLKEYWLNIEDYLGNNPEGISKVTYKQTPIEDLFSTEPKSATAPANMIPSKLFKKTSKFGLFYDITRDSGEYDADGIPIVEEAFLFSNEEILIKLFALKQKLKNYFLPLNARIVDIVGELLCYARYDVNIWQDQLRVDDVELNINPCVKITPDDGCSLIEDLTAQNFSGYKIPPDMDMAGVSDFVAYGIGATYQYGPAYGSGYNFTGVGDKWKIHDTVSGASFTYTTTIYGATVSTIVDNLMALWSTQTIEPFTQFELTKELNPAGMTSILGASAADYAWFYAIQDDIIGPTSGSNFIVTLTPTAGPSTVQYNTPGATYTGNLAPALGTGPMTNYANAFIGYFNGTNTPVADLNDYPCAPIAAPYILENCSFKLDWNEAKTTWDSVDYANAGGTLGTNYSDFDYSYTSSSYPLGNTNPYGGATGVTSSGPSGGVSFIPLPGFPGGATPGATLHPPGPTYTVNFQGGTGPTANPIIWNWQTLGQGNFLEMQWIVTFETLPTPTGATSWVLDSGLLSISQGETWPILLPYAGTYKLELRLYDAFGSFSSYIQKAKLCVDTKDVDFIGHYRSRECKYTWDKKTIKRQSDRVPAPIKKEYPDWDHYNSTWSLPLQENEQMSMEDLTYNDLDRIEFYQTQNDPQYQGYCETVDTLPLQPGSSESSGLYDLDAYKWNLIESNASWEDVCHLWWDGMGPKYAKFRIGYPSLDVAGAQDDFSLVMIDENVPYRDPMRNNQHSVGIVANLNPGIVGPTNPSFGDLRINLDAGATGITNIYQYLGGPTGIVGGTSWVESKISWDRVLITDTNLASATYNEKWKEATRQIIEQQYDGTHPLFEKYITYYSEMYNQTGATANILTPYIELRSKEYGKYARRHLYGFKGNHSTNAWNDIFFTSTFGPIVGPSFSMTPSWGTTAWALPEYTTVNWGDNGDIPFYFEIFGVGACGGMIGLPGPTVLTDAYGGTSIGPVNWEYQFGNTSFSTLWQALTYRSEGLNTGGTGPNGQTGVLGSYGPISDYEWNIVYGASGYTGSTSSFPPPTGLTAIKIQGSKRSILSYETGCIGFTGMTAAGYTGAILGGTHGFIGTKCGRSITANSTWNTLRIHKYAKTFPLLSQVQFNYSLSPMHGKTKPMWKLIKENDNKWVNIYYNNPYFSYLFTQPGSYTIELSVTDGNGNIKTETKKEFIKII